MNRYPRLDSVSMKMGFRASSPRTARMAAMLALQHLRLNVRLRPERLQEFIVGHQSPGVLDEIPQHGKSLRRQKNVLLRHTLTSPQALVDGVEPEGWKLSHRSTN
jgi:hypothetical protein